MARRSKILSFPLKLAVSALLLFLVFRHVAWPDVLAHLAGVDWGWIVLALGLTWLSHYLSALRFRHYLCAEPIPCSLPEALDLHFRGTVLNLALPGGVGGDVYKAIRLHRRHGVSMKRLMQLSLSNRLSGVFLLLLLSLLLSGFSPFFRAQPASLQMLALAASLIGTATYAMFAARFLAEPPRVQRQAALYSLGVQACMAATAWAIALAIGGTARLIDTIILFLLACLASVLPVSLGGIGVREWVLMKGGLWIGLDASFGVTLAMLFFALYVVASVGFLLLLTTFRTSPPKPAP